MGKPGTDDDRRRHEQGEELRAQQRLTLQQVRSLSEDDLVNLHDQLVDPASGYDWLIGPLELRAELDRRATVYQTKWIIGLTVLITLLTLTLIAIELGWLDWLRATTAP